MRKKVSSYRGAYLQTPSRRSSSSKSVLHGGVFGAVVVITLFVLLKGAAIGTDAVYHLPDEVPSISIPKDLEDRSDSHKLEELVIPYYDFQLDAGNTTIDVSLPLIQAGYGADFNAAVVNQLENLISNTTFHLEHGASWVVKRLSYEAYLDQNILTVLIMTETDDQTRCESWIFDLSNGGGMIATSELVERLLGLDYATFLWITDQHIQNDFSTTYHRLMPSMDRMKSWRLTEESCVRSPVILLTH